jgi:hypothetical protein
MSPLYIVAGLDHLIYLIVTYIPLHRRKDFPSLNGVLKFHIQCVLLMRLVCGK